MEAQSASVRMYKSPTHRTMSRAMKDNAVYRGFATVHRTILVRLCRRLVKSFKIKNQSPCTERCLV
eukprot:scaffold499_cov335-Pavlova_lutheri.AAC.9